MPRIVKNPKTRSQIQIESDARRGIVRKSFSVQKADAEFIKQSADALGIPQNKMIMDALRAYMKTHAPKDGDA